MRDHPAWRLDKGRIPDFLDGLGVPIALPADIGGGEIEFRVRPDGEKPAAGYRNSAISPVRHAYPQSQVLWRYRLGPMPAVETPPAPFEMAIFGVRSCDVKAFRHLETFFGRQPADTPFVEAAAGILLVNIVCSEPGENCFCVCCDAGPSLEEQFDIQLTDLGDFYLMETATPKGAAAAERVGRLLAPSPAADRDEAAALREATLGRFTITSHMGTGIRKTTSRKAAEEIWRRLAARCVECGGCALVCPMCTCFDVADLQETPEEGRRERTRDCCQYSGYSREASGFNPRPDKVSRFKRRFSHKLGYFTMLAEGMHGCVGCGRCVNACFGGVDMPAVVNALRTESIATG
jgi:formate hydrogenlyase subunit 6/NADH:ubiquinone oxidoreductase subunit I